ncbi:unnamed protein product, partial [Timema podura]|nr:unnamed protein product [Timema podura]
ENSIHHIDHEHKEQTRHLIGSHLQKTTAKNLNKTNPTHVLTDIKKLKKKLQTNKIINIKADKVNTIVLIDQDEYVSKTPDDDIVNAETSRPTSLEAVQMSKEWN